MDAAPRLLENPAVAYTGRAGPLYRLMLVNLLLTILTLGVFRFWARTRLRRYLWSSTRLGGEPFEYTGTAGELLRGFLRALAVLVPLVLLLAAGQLFLPPQADLVVRLPLYLLLLYLGLVGQFTAQRYQLRRSTWRGIRFGMDGSAFVYGRQMSWRWLLAPFTLFIMLPWIAAGRLRRTLGRARFGTARFSFAGNGSDLFMWMVLTAILFAMIAVAGFVAARDAFASAFWRDLLASTPGHERAALTLFAEMVLTITVVLAAVWISGAVYRAATLQFTMQNLSLEGLAFEYRASIGRTALFLVGNTLLVLLSLGLLLPLALHRRMRFLVGAIATKGALDLARVGQAEAGEPYGEGLADTLGLEAGPI